MSGFILHTGGEGIGDGGDVWSTVEVYDLHTRRWQPLMKYAYNSLVSSHLIDVSKNGRYFIYSSDYNAIKLVRLYSEENKIEVVNTTPTRDPEVKKTNEEILKARLRKIHFSPDDSFVVVITGDNEVLIVEPIKGKILKRYSFNLLISDALLSPDNKRLITLSPGSVCIWDVG